MTLVEQIAGRIERDRMRIEPRAVANAAQYGRRAMMHAIHALRLGHDPEDAARRVLVGDDRIDQPGLGEYLTDVLVNAHLLGMRRTRLNAGAHARESGIRFSREEENRRKKELAILLLLLMLDEDEKRALFATYRRLSLRIVDGLVKPLSADLHALRAARVAGQSALNALPKTAAMRLADAAPFRADPESLRAYETAARLIFRSNGIIPQHEARIESWVQSAITRAYERGRAAEWKRPQTKELLWGYHYCAILDSKTTELCRKLDGMSAPIDDPVWIRWTPPNHFNCRSALVEVWQSNRLARKPEIIEPKATAEDLLRFMEIKRKFESYL